MMDSIITDIIDTGWAISNEQLKGDFICTRLGDNQSSTSSAAD